MTRDQIATLYRDLIEDAAEHPITPQALFRLAGLFAAEPDAWEAFQAHVRLMTAAFPPGEAPADGDRAGSPG